MNTIRRVIAKLRGQGERGSAASAMLVIVPTLIVVIGLVVDGAGKIQANERADQVAASAARAATNAISGDTVMIGSLSLNATKAQQTAQDYIAAAGMTGTVTVAGQVVSVEVKTTYTTRFISLIGIGTLPGTGEASAQLITQ